MDRCFNVVFNAPHADIGTCFLTLRNLRKEQGLDVVEGSTVRNCKKDSKKFVKKSSRVSKKLKKRVKNWVEDSSESNMSTEKNHV